MDRGYQHRLRRAADALSGAQERPLRRGARARQSARVAASRPHGSPEGTARSVQTMARRLVMGKGTLARALRLLLAPAWLAACGGGAAGGAASGEAASATAKVVAPPGGGTYLGAYDQKDGRAAFEEALGRRVGVH